jgi:hypothetical protein
MHPEAVSKQVSASSQGTEPFSRIARQPGHREQLYRLLP